MRVGLLGGTFDPIHLGHLVIAEEARLRLGLDLVLFIPAGQPPHKREEGVSPAADRLEMVRAAIGDHPGFSCSEVELLRPGASYTVDTLAALQAQYPQASLFWLLGTDSVTELHTWHDPERLYRLATFVGLARPGWSRREVDRWLADQPPDLRPRLEFVEIPLLDISSSALRAALAAGGSVRYLAPDAVLAYAHAHGLYRGGGASDA